MDVNARASAPQCVWSQQSRGAELRLVYSLLLLWSSSAVYHPSRPLDPSLRIPPIRILRLSRPSRPSRESWTARQGASSQTAQAQKQPTNTGRSSTLQRCTITIPAALDAVRGAEELLRLSSLHLSSSCDPARISSPAVLPTVSTRGTAVQVCPPRTCLQFTGTPARM